VRRSTEFRRVMLFEFQNLTRERIRSKGELSCMQDKGGERAVEKNGFFFLFSFINK
jgi:hypothetical protein